MFNEPEEAEEPASVLVNINSGSYDIKNLPGFKRKQLMDSGEMSVDNLVQADNMPGYKLKEMRDRFKENNDIPVDTNPVTIDINTLEEGSLVSYRNIVTPAEKINVKKKLVYINIKGKKKGWISVSKLKAVVVPPDNEDEE